MPIRHLLWLCPKERPIILCPTLSFSLILWDRLAARYGFKSPYTPLAPLLQNPASTLCLHPHNCTWWMNKGLLHIADLCDHRGVLLQACLRERHFLHTLKCKSNLTSSTSMEYLCKTFDRHTGHISKLYSMLTNSPIKLFYMENGYKI